MACTQTKVCIVKAHRSPRKSATRQRKLDRNPIFSDVKGILFDFDGTLADSIDLYWKAFNEGLVHVGLKPVQRCYIDGELSAGTPFKEILVRLFGVEVEQREDLLDEFRKRMAASFRILWSRHVKLFPNATPVLRSLSRNGLKIAIVTGRRNATEDILKLLRSYKIESCINAVVSGEEVPLRKPAPDIIFEGAKRLQLAPSDCVVVGDSIADVRASKAAGAQAIALTTGVGDRDALTNENPYCTLDNLRELAPLFTVKHTRKKPIKHHHRRR